MNSINKNKKIRKKTVLSCRKIGSTSNKSQRSFCHSASENRQKRQISALQKNNKVLALALEDARRELSTQQKFTDEIYQNFNNMLLARFKILELKSSLESFIKNFDEVLLLLKVDDTKWSNVAAPVQSEKQIWKNKMKKIGKSVHMHLESLDEGIDTVAKTVKNNQNEVSNVKFLPDGVNEIMKSSLDVNMKNTESETIIVNKPDERNGHCSMTEICGVSNTKMNDQYLSSDTENITSAQVSSDIHKTECQLSSNVLSKDCEGIMEIEKVAILSTENTGTPKLNISSKLFSTKAFSESEASVLPSDVNVSETSKNSCSIMPLVKSVHSRIPKIQGLNKKKNKENSTENFSEERLTKKKVVENAEEPNLNLCERKKEIIKMDTKLPKDNPPVVLDKITKPEFSSEETVRESELCEIDERRKTFVVKPSDKQENIHSSCDRRKTFVKSSDMNNRRQTFIVPELSTPLPKSHEELNDHKENDAVECIQKDVHLCANGTANKTNKPGNITGTFTASELSSPLPKSHTEITDHKEIDAVECIDAQKDEYLSTNAITNKITTVELSKELHCNSANLKNKNNHDHPQCSLEMEKNYQGEDSREFNKKETVEVNCLQSHSVENSKVLDNIACSLSNDIVENKNMNDNEICNKTRIHSSESSDSECESIPELNLHTDNEIAVLKNIPVRGKITRPRKKVFLFDAYKESTINEKSVCNFGKSSNFLKEKAPCSSDTDTIKEKKHQIVKNWKEKKETRITFSDSSKKNNVDDNNFFLSNHEKKLEIPANKKVESKVLLNECTEERMKDCNSFALGPDCFENCVSSQLDTNIKHNELCNNLDTSFEILLNEKNKNHKINAKENVTKDAPDDDIIPIPSNSKKRKESIKKKSVKKVQKNSNKTERKNSVNNHVEVHLVPETSSYNKGNEDVQEHKMKLPKLSKTENKKRKKVVDEMPVEDIFLTHAKGHPLPSSCAADIGNSNMGDGVQESEMKPQKKSSKTENKKLKEKVHKMSNKNSFLTYAEIHPVPSSLASETDSFNKENAEVQELEIKVQKKSSKTENKRKEMIHKMSDKDSSITHAKIYPVPSSYASKTGISDKEKEVQDLEMKTQKMSNEIGNKYLEVSVLLNDIFKSENSNSLVVHKKGQTFQEGRTCPLKTVYFSDNPHNILLHTDIALKKNTLDATGTFKDIGTFQNDDGITVETTSVSEDSNRRRRKQVNYKEISLRKKLRQ